MPYRPEYGHNQSSADASGAARAIDTLLLRAAAITGLLACLQGAAACALFKTAQLLANSLIQTR
jgi:hypothetical protein